MSINTSQKTGMSGILDTNQTLQILRRSINDFYQIILLKKKGVIHGTASAFLNNSSLTEGKESICKYLLINLAKKHKTKKTEITF